MTLPERINVMKVVSYDVAQIVADIKNERKAFGNYNSNVSHEEVMERVEDWAADDFGSSYGLIYQDENGEEL